jgi:hypothetical protein
MAGTRALSRDRRIEGRLVQLARRVAPWIIAAAIAVFIFARVDVRQVAACITRVNAPAYLGTIFTFTALVLVLDALATSRLFRTIGADATFATVLVVRGASYLLGVVNYHAGQAHLTLLLTRMYRMPLLRVAGGTLVTYLTVLGALVVLASPTLLPIGDHAAWITRTAAMSLGGSVLYLLVIAARPKLLSRWALLGVLVELGVLGHLRLLAWRLPHVAMLVLENWVAYRFFGVTIPPAQSVTSLSIVLLVSALPITPMGIGTRELAAVALLAPFAHGVTSGDRAASVVAAGATLATTTTISQFLIGLAFVRRGARIIAPLAAAAEPERITAAEDSSARPRTESSAG